MIGITNARLIALSGATLVVAAAIVAAVYDPQVELFPGRTISRSRLATTLAVWDVAGQGREPAWVNPQPRCGCLSRRTFIDLPVDDRN